MPTKKKSRPKKARASKRCFGISEQIDKKDWTKGCKCRDCGMLNEQCSFKGKHAHDRTVGTLASTIGVTPPKEKKPKKATKLPSMTPEQIKQLATDIFQNRVFTDRHINPHESSSTVGMVFMPLVLGAGMSKSYISDIGMIYEYLDKAGPRAINGYPIFTSVRFASKRDTQQVWDLYNKMKEAVATVTA